MIKSKKKSDASIRVLETLKLLSAKSASVSEIINHLEQTNHEKKVYTNEAILKYINTLKVFGFKFAKEKGKHVLLNAHPKFNFTEDELIGLRLLEKSANQFPEQEVKTRVIDLLNDMQNRFSDETTLMARRIKRHSLKNLEFSDQKYHEMIKKLEMYCLDGQKIKISYKVQKSEVSVIAEPNEINYVGNKVYFSIYNPMSAQVHEIKLDDITEIDQLPLRANPMSITSSVTFILKDRLANAYKLKDNERLLSSNPDGSVVVINQKEDRALLLKRLMRYGENCEVLSPKDLRIDMAELIRATIENYK